MEDNIKIYLKGIKCKKEDFFYLDQEHENNVFVSMKG
jgi:hypothetical protein